jgi:predicted nucleotidyltransferase
MNDERNNINDAAINDLLREVISRIVQVANPEKIILFGSLARGKYDARSDIDLLVVKRNVNRGELTGRIYESLIGVGVPVDVIVAHPEDLKQYADCPSTVFYPALREGTAVYVM